MEKISKWLIIGVLALYVVSSVDPAPGSADDAVEVLDIRYDHEATTNAGLIKIQGKKQ